MYEAGSDVGRTYVGTGTVNIPLATLDDIGSVDLIATAGQTDIAVVSSSDVILRIDAVTQTETIDYDVIDTVTLRLLTPLVGGEVITIIDTSDIATAIDNLRILEQASDEALAYAIALG